VLAFWQIGAGGVLQLCPAQGSARHAPSSQPALQVVSTKSYVHRPPEQIPEPAYVRSVFSSLQIGSPGVSHTTPSQALVPPLPAAPAAPPVVAPAVPPLAPALPPVAPPLPVSAPASEPGEPVASPLSPESEEREPAQKSHDARPVDVHAERSYASVARISLGRIGRRSVRPGGQFPMPSPDGGSVWRF
jgi:hypothetical protein